MQRVDLAAAGVRLAATLVLIAAVASALRSPDQPVRGSNRLAREPSPYLQMHAHNPVDWYPWGEEAFARARSLNRPILLSIGYATCHWCHVMAEESFEDPEIAAYLNAHYVAIKVDREQRPDVDAVYLDAVQAMGQGGGWPLTVWLTPDLQPFYGGTYFPPRSGVRGQRVGFLDLLTRLDEAFRAEPDRVAAAAADVVARLERSATPPPGSETPGTDTLRRAVDQLRASFDVEHGGFGRAPKFPRPVTLDLLLRWHRRTRDPQALDMVVRTLDAMAAGGIRDHLGGGFHRYATDAAWRIPHFEKMLYDNALLATTYLDAARAAGRQDLTEVARSILDWMLAEMAAPAGGFHAALDADSGGGEGRYYTWTPGELHAAVADPTARRLAAAYYGVTPAGDIEGRSVLRIPRPLAEVAASEGVDVDEAPSLLASARGALLHARALRPAPPCDRKVVTAWNGLALSALAHGALVLGDARYLDAAERTAELLVTHLRDRGRLVRSSFDGTRAGAGVLEDYAFTIAGLLDLFETTSAPRWLSAALALQRVQDAQFADPAGGYFRTAADAERLLVREKPDYDGAEPSGNSVAARNLLRLDALQTDPRWRTAVEGSLRAFAPTLEGNPDGLPAMLSALEAFLDRAKEIVIVVPPGTSGAPLLDVVHSRFLPNAELIAVVAGAPQEELAGALPVVADKPARDGRPTAYVCERQVCQLPTTDPVALAGELDRVAPLP